MKITIIPDVHGRSFWKGAIKANDLSGPIIFLGDYLDPYYFDVYYKGLTLDKCVQNFKEIIEVKKSFPDKVTLLLGNHDCGYMYGKEVCNCRCDIDRYSSIQSLFKNNARLFQMASEITMKNKHYIFSHAGLSVGWLDRHIGMWDENNVVELLNAQNVESLATERPEITTFAEALAERDAHRCGDNNYSSPVWQDAELMATQNRTCNAFQIVGHTKCKHYHPVFLNNCWFLDCDGLEWFSLSENGTLRDSKGKICRNQFPNPLNPPIQDYDSKKMGEDCFGKPFCRECGSRRIFIRTGMMASTWRCEECGNYDVMR